MNNRIREELGVRYEKVLTAVSPGGAPAMKDLRTGKVVPVQRVPAMPQDRTNADAVDLALLDLEPGQELDLEAAAEAVPAAIRIQAEGQHVVIANGNLAVRVPADADLEEPFPGPIEGIRVGSGPWFGRSTIVHVPFRGRVETVIESLGTCCVQWRTTYRWGNDAAFVFRARWAAGADAIQVVDDVSENSDAAVEWLPFDATRAQAYCWGGGERMGPMQKLDYKAIGMPAVRRGTGRRRLQYISHIGYWNQWNLCWAGFAAATAPDDRFVGIFSMEGSLWQRRGFMRLEIWEDDNLGHMVRVPLKQGRRLYGLLISNRAESGIDAADRRCLLNRRKVQLSDLALDKVRQWVLDPPLDDRTSHLADPRDLETFRARLALDPSIGAALDAWLAAKAEHRSGQFAVGLAKDDRELMRAAAAPIIEHARTMLAEVADGGFERLIIFDGRWMKGVAYDVDLLWMLGLLDERDYRTVRKAPIAVGAYMFSDPGYCNYTDFRPHTEPPEEGIEQALKDNMGDCPVPPNFSSELFSTVGVMAEMFEKHPLHDRWRQWAMEQNDRFMETFYEHDGTYHESVNYHTHEFSERLLHMYPLRWKGVRDFFAEPKVKGCFEHFLAIQMPPLSDSIEPLKDATASRYNSVHTLYADWSLPRRAILPADGNSGGSGIEQEHRGELSAGAWIYRETDPVFSAAQMNAWRLAGKPIPLHTHAVLTMITIDPSIGAKTKLGRTSQPWTSVHRVGMAVISKASKPDGSPVWCLFRAGHATHHMDFDQGNLHLAAWDSVLLGEHGYHTVDNEGHHLGGAETWLHSTVMYSENRHDSSGYTGLERAPDPFIVYLGDKFDWAGLRIVNTNLRPCDRLPYFAIVPRPITRHVRHYLFVKPDYFLVWDVFEEAHGPSVFRLHPRLPMVQEAACTFRSGTPGKPHLLVKFLQPAAPQVIESEKFGPLWSFAARNETGQPYMVLLVPEVEDLGVKAELAADGRTVTVTGKGLHDEIRLPEPGTMGLPVVKRGK